MQEKVYEIFLNESLEIVIVFDSAGRILFCNRAAEEELGYPEGMIGVPMANVLIKEFETGKTCNDVFAFLKEKREAFCYRFNETCFRAMVRIAFDSSRERYYFFALNEEKNEKLEHEIGLVKEMAEQAVRVRDEFVANMTHELRTPLNGIHGHVENLKDGCLTSEQRKTLEIIEGCCNNMSSIINNILDFSKLEAGRLNWRNVVLRYGNAG